MSQSQHTDSLLGAAAKLSPPTGVLVAEAAGWTLQDWVLGATLLYTVLMILKLLWDWFIKPKLDKKAQP